MVQALSVGKEVLSYCSKCKLKLHAMIVSMVNDRPAKVQCQTCKTTQKYKPDSPGSRSKKPATRRKKAPTVSAHELWQSKLQDNQQEAEKYSIRGQYQKDSFLQHPKFGMGFVEEVLEGDKINVLFRHDYKVLVHNK